MVDNKSIHVYFFYDIACVLDTHLRVRVALFYLHTLLFICYLLHVVVPYIRVFVLNNVSVPEHTPGVNT